MAGSHPLAGVQGFWDDVMDDMEATAEEYREAGWTVHELHPGDVTPLPNRGTEESGIDVDRLGLDVLLPGDEFRTVQSLVEEGATFDEYDAYRAEQGDVVFLVLAMKDESAGTAVVFPLYYAVTEAMPLLRGADELGEFRTYLRPLDDSSRVVFTQRDPDNLLPTDWGEEDGPDDESGSDAASETDSASGSDPESES